MQRTCTSCGAEIFPGARFCRRCGAPLRESGGDGTGDVSPQSPTVPLHDESRATDGLSEGEERVSADTSRVSRVELERLLRLQQGAEQTSKPVADSVASSSELEATPSSSDLGAHDAEATTPASPARTRPDAPAAVEVGDEELTISVPRPVRSLETRESAADFGTAARVPVTTVHEISPVLAQSESEQTFAQTSGAASVQTDAGVTRTVAPTQVRTAATAARTHAAPHRRWPLVVAVCAAVFLFAVAAALLGWRLLRRPSLAELPTQAPTATPAPAAVQQFEAKLAEAESLLAGGDMDGAMSRLREANALDPANTRAHRRLGELLLAAGARREAVEEFRAVTRNAPDDSTAWRQLAAAQFAEGLYRESAESYRRLVELVGESSADPNDLLVYADALRLSGRTEEARSLYERLASAPQSDATAGIARQRLVELAQAQPVPTPTRHPGETAQTPGESETASAGVPPQPTPAPPAPTPAPQAQPTPASVALPASATPAEHYRHGVGLWSSNRAAALSEFRAAAAGGNVDAHYYLGLSYVEGRDLHTLKRAELVAALQHFQIAQRGGQHAAEARGYAQQLEKEFDRLRKQ